MPNKFGLGQVVTNSNSLAEYRRATDEVEWMPDLHLANEKVGYFTLRYQHSTMCATYVQSFEAGVITQITSAPLPGPPNVDACKLVEDFTRAYIDKIPG